MDYFLQLVLNGLFVGAFYALVALGYTMVYGIIKLLNFAHGDIYMVGGFVGFTMLTAASGAMGAKGGLLLLIAVMVLAMLTTGTLGLIIERIAYRPLRGAPRRRSSSRPSARVSRSSTASPWPMAPIRAPIPWAWGRGPSTSSVCGSRPAN